MKRVLRTCLATGAAVTAAVVFAVSGAQAAAAPGWRYAAVYQVDGMTSVSASGATNAWAVGPTFDGGPCDDPCSFASHWNGKKWQRIALPDLPVDGDYFGSVTVAAMAGGRAWVFVSMIDSVSSTGQEVAVEWNGTSWSAALQLPGSPSGPIASDPDDVWGFENDNGTPVADHYNGTRWNQVPIAVNVSKARASHGAGDWVVGTVPTQPTQPTQVEVLHWSKGAWKNVPLPKILVPKGDQMSPGALALGTSKNSVWATVGVGPVKGSGPVTTILLHWNGTAWTRVAYPKGVGIDELASDGYGGAWVASYQGSNVVMYHYHALRWTHVTVPARSGFTSQLTGDMELIPGTRSILAPLTLQGSPRFNGAVLKYGP